MAQGPKDTHTNSKWPKPKTASAQNGPQYTNISRRIDSKCELTSNMLWYCSIQDSILANISTYAVIDQHHHETYALS
jgi:hypothetical protein